MRFLLSKVTLLMGVVLFVSCGPISKIFKKENKDQDQGPLKEYIIGLEGFSSLSGPDCEYQKDLLTETRYRQDGKKESEVTCTYNTPGLLVQSTSKSINFADLNVLKDSEYFEYAYSAEGKLTERNEWTDSTKATASSQLKITYDSTGKATSIESKAFNSSGQLRTLETISLDDKELPSQTIEISYTNGSESERQESTCWSFGLWPIKPCETKTNNVVTQTITQDGDSWTLRYFDEGKLEREIKRTPLEGVRPGSIFGQEISKTFDDQGQKIDETIQTCTKATGTLICESKSTLIGFGTYSEISETYSSLATVRLQIGKNAYDVDSGIVLTGNFDIKTRDKKYTGSISRTPSDNLLRVDSKLSVTVATAEGSNLLDDTPSTPISWVSVFYAVERILADSQSTASVSFRESNRLDANDREILEEITEITAENPAFIRASSTVKIERTFR
jgi:hypothetical protein